MANPTQMQTNKPALVEATTTQSSIDLDEYRSYTIKHLGVNASGSEATGAIFYSYENAGDSAPTVTASFAAGSNKGALQSGESRVVVKAHKLHFKTLSGSPVFQIIPML